MATRIHPFLKWKREANLTYPQIAEKCAAAGRSTTGDYLKHIANGRRWPDGQFAVLLSRKITKNAVSVETFLTFGR